MRITEELRTWPGYLGTESFDTLESGNPEVIVVLRFNNRERLDAWLHSEKRAAFIAEVREYVDDYTIRRIGTGFEGWFEYSHDASPPVPWRQGMVVLAALFPVIMILRHLLGYLFKVLPLPAAFLILLTLDLAVLTYFVMPHFTRFMNFWLRPRPDATWRTELAGWSVLLGLIGIHADGDSDLWGLAFLRQQRFFAFAEVRGGLAGRMAITAGRRIRPSVHRWIRIAARTERLGREVMAGSIEAEEIEAADDGIHIQGSFAEGASIAIGNVKIDRGQDQPRALRQYVILPPAYDRGRH